MSDIARWELKTHAVNITKANFATVETDPTFLWARKDKEGKTEWERLQQWAAEGWELVSVIPIVTANSLSNTSTLLYTFKRPLP